MTAPHLQFRHLHADVLTATAALLEAGTSTLPRAQAQDEFQQWADTAAGAYRLPRPTVSIDNGSTRPAAGYYGYIPSPGYGYGSDAIYLRGRSVIDLLTSFRRHMQAHGIPLTAGGPDADAAAWALSLYHTLRPRQLALLAAEGSIPGLTAADLSAGHAAPSLASWAARQRATSAANSGPSPSTTAPDSDPAAGLPIEVGMRGAIFAALRDHYGTQLAREDRLAKLSQFTGRRVGSIRELTRAEGSRVLGTLTELAADPAACQIQDARAFIRRAASEGRITIPARDRYLTMLADEHVRADSAREALDAIRDRAISLYHGGEFCGTGLAGFLRAAGLPPYDG